MKKRDIINLIILIIVVSFAAYRFYHRKYTLTKSKFALDTIVEITVTSQNKELDNLLDKAFDLIEQYDKKFSYFQEGSELWNINHSEMDSVQIDKDFYEILQISEDLFFKSDSLYDFTIGSLSDLWDFSMTHIPSLDSIEIAQRSIGFEKIDYSENILFHCFSKYIPDNNDGRFLDSEIHRKNQTLSCQANHLNHSDQDPISRYMPFYNLRFALFAQP